MLFYYFSKIHLQTVENPKISRYFTQSRRTCSTNSDSFYPLLEMTSRRFGSKFVRRQSDTIVDETLGRCYDHESYTEFSLQLSHFPLTEPLETEGVYSVRVTKSGSIAVLPDGI